MRVFHCALGVIASMVLACGTSGDGGGEGEVGKSDEAVTCPTPGDLNVQYIGGGDSRRPITFCLLADFECEEGQQAFDIPECGCGCVDETPVCPDASDP